MKSTRLISELGSQTQQPVLEPGVFVPAAPTVSEHLWEKNESIAKINLEKKLFFVSSSLTFIDEIFTLT